mmetsp:Transcript_6632/g.11833  ORF Transcript_6632/g.11833 Transcript_6632/m.11833 type:complete len:609 (-) Transcript_6632:772-2598(-)|eukprot:CAMPEP_0182441156 /NCGR_PEP_ID=MMETSP1172-20130603/107_1 /TAXON_ID=708627 /ORGANISM="Timspurckia oligopyrenoides, Strain CCMP3278" /LENGTH=608 /DNA_ID=CAMNT_0024635317 /DNA_START=76 /DNA_END=1902 /DNA_ORIENTATION=-
MEFGRPNLNPFGKDGSTEGVGGGAVFGNGGGGSDANNKPRVQLATGLNSCAIDVAIGGDNLRGMYGTPEAFCIVFLRASGFHDWIEIGRSETRNASGMFWFDHKFPVSYHFELFQQIRVAVFDSSNLQTSSSHTLIGATDFPLASIIRSPVTLPLLHQQKESEAPLGSIVVKAMKSNKGSKLLTMRWGLSEVHIPEVPGTKAKRIGKSSAPAQPVVGNARVVALAALRADVTGQRWELVARSKPATLLNTDIGMGVELAIEATIQQLSENDDSRLIRLVPELVGTDGNPTVPIGHITTSISALRVLPPGTSLTVQGSHGGVLRSLGIEARDQTSFFDTISNTQCELNLMAAVDFTASNEPVSDPRSLHRVVPSKPNQYEASLRAMLTILSAYAPSLQVPVPIPAYGFGANLPPEWKTSHCFSLTGSPQDPFCRGIDGVIAAYHATLSAVQFHGPTVLSHVLRTAAITVSRQLGQAQANARGNAGAVPLSYHILVVVTDGVLSDHDSTVEELVRVSALPLSVVIVGVGNDDFSAMREFMDYQPGTDPPMQPGTKTVLRTRGGHASLRDNVQFVCFRDFKGDLSRMAAKALAAVPYQVTSYVNLRQTAAK